MTSPAYADPPLPEPITHGGVELRATRANESPSDVTYDWELKSSTGTRTFKNSRPGDLSLSPDGRSLALPGKGFSLLDVKTGQTREVLSLAFEGPCSVDSRGSFVWSPDGRTVAFVVAKQNKAVLPTITRLHLYDVASGRFMLFDVAAWMGCGADCHTGDLVWSPDSRLLAVSGLDSDSEATPLLLTVYRRDGTSVGSPIALDGLESLMGWSSKGIQIGVWENGHRVQKRIVPFTAR